MKEEEILLTLADAAKMLGVSTHTIRRWDKEGNILCHRTIGNARRVPMSEVTRIKGRNSKNNPTE